MQRLAGDVGRLVGREIDHRGGDVVGVPSRPAGTLVRIASRCFSLSLSVIGVAMKPGAMQFAVTPRLRNSCASDLIMPIMPALAAV